MMFILHFENVQKLHSPISKMEIGKKTFKRVKPVQKLIMKKQILIEKFIKKLDFSYAYKTKNERQNIINELYKIAGIEQLDLPVVVGSSDKIVIEVSDNELLIVTREELKDMQESAIEFDGFEGWIVKGRLV